MADLPYTIGGRKTLTAGEIASVAQIKAAANVPVLIIGLSGGSETSGIFSLTGDNADFTASSLTPKRIRPVGTETPNAQIKPPANATEDNTTVTHDEFWRREVKGFDLPFIPGRDEVRINGGSRVSLRIKNTTGSTEDYSWEVVCME